MHDLALKKKKTKMIICYTYLLNATCYYNFMPEAY